MHIFLHTTQPASAADAMRCDDNINPTAYVVFVVPFFHGFGGSRKFDMQKCVQRVRNRNLDSGLEIYRSCSSN